MPDSVAVNGFGGNLENNTCTSCNFDEVGGGYYIWGSNNCIAPGTTQVIDVKCRRGQQLTGGGIEELDHSSATDVEDSHPRGNGWEGSVTNNDSVSHDADAEALCLKK